MIIKVPIVRGQAIYRDAKYLGMMFILEYEGKRQLHSENKDISPIVAYKECKRFIKGERNLYTMCYAGRANSIRLILRLGFKEIGKKGNLIIFVKE
jgi:hypothetical protein